MHSPVPPNELIMDGAGAVAVDLGGVGGDGREGRAAQHGGSQGEPGCSEVVPTSKLGGPGQHSGS